MSPFSIYKDFDACVRANQDKDNPEAYCATIERKIKGETKNNPGNNEENSYNGYGFGSSSLQNVTDKSKRKSI